MEPDGVGALYMAYEQLRAKLEKEGLFAEERKKPLPRFPKRIGIVTSPTGAAIRDMLHITGRRFPSAEIVLYPALVQGADAAASIARGIRYFNTKKSVDLLIVGRGGGSLEDLWAFNEELLVRAVADSALPVISAVGHETDFTLCDFAADLRAPTPSAAAELAVPDTEELLSSLGHMNDRISLAMNRRLARSRDRLGLLSASRMLKDPRAFIDDKRMALAMDEQALYTRMERILAAKRAEFQYKTAKMEALNPLAVVARGYSAVFDEKGVLVKSVSQLAPGDGVSFALTDGKVHARVEKIESEKIREEDQNGGKKEENV
jgi:exodeoxyribonuclease VII large subunit